MKYNHHIKKMKMVVTGIITLLLVSIAFSASAAVYTYDSLHRLESVTFKNGQKIVYTYDPGGNMLTVDSHDADTPPTVKSTDPTNGAIDVSVSANVYVTFSETVVEDVYFNDINIMNTLDSSVVESTYSLNGDLLTIDPFNDFDYSVTYAVYIPAGAVKDTGGNSLANTYSFSFTTIAAQDTTPPVVTSTDPLNGETGVAIDKIITIAFSEAIQQGDSFNEIRLSLGGATVSSATYINGNYLSIDPDTSLGYSNNYTVTIPAGSLKDQAGNSLADEYSFGFTTEANPDITPPTVTASPAGGLYNEPQNVTLTASEPANIYYTTDGTDPTTSSTQYTGAVSINGNLTLKFMAVDQAGNQSIIYTETYAFDTVSPVVSSTDPVNGSVNVPMDKLITINFSEDVQPGDNFSGITINTGSTIVDYTYSINGGTLTLTL